MKPWPLLCALLCSAAAAQLPSARATASSSASPDALCANSPEVCDTRITFDAKKFDNTDDAKKLRLRLWPRPWLGIGAAAMPGGYAPLGEWAAGGLDVESRHLVAGFSAMYDNGHKTNDGDQPNPKGHDRHLQGSVCWRLTALHRPKWFVGGGYEWSQLSTTNYTKGGRRPTFGGGYDLYFDRLGSRPECAGCWFSARISVDWVMAGTDWQNGGHGLQIGMVLPRPTEKRHVFFVWGLAVYSVHTSVTEPSNLELTREQRSQKFFDPTSSLGVKFRF